MTTTYVPPGAGHHYPMMNGDHVMKAAVDDSQGAFEVFEVVAPAAPMTPPHVSPWTAVLYLVEGRVTVMLDGTTYDVEPGGLVVFPAGTPGTFEVVTGTARMIGITSGTGAGPFFAEMADSVPRDRPVEESLEAILAVTRRHGVQVAGA
ncbi:cupin domain-containing protein [Nocardioides sediminis]|uniref:cupin domain-containing protein n=1 Tax=Nocardioides sediminis TaxID=433648 RepID=UPI000D317F75|nr:cupin domain-containing protein [Nocardioides sediminis]